MNCIFDADKPKIQVYVDGKTLVDDYLSMKEDKLELFCNATGLPSTFSYEWRHNGKIMSNIQKIIINKQLVDDGGNYSCRSTNKIGTSTSKFFKIWVYSK